MICLGFFSENNKYSVLMTVYNKADKDSFKEAVESILNQSIVPEQIVISEDGLLTNELEECIYKFQKEYPTVFTIVRNEKKGNYNAANNGLKVCRNEFVARMDSDDIAKTDRCEKELKVLINNKCDIVGSFCSEFTGSYENIISIRKVPLKHEEIVRYAKKRNPFNHPTIMFRKSMALKCGAYSNMIRCEDYDFVVKMILSGAKCLNIPESLLYYRLSDDTFLRRKNWNNTKGFIYVRYKNFKRGFTPLKDLIFLSALQIILYLMPISVTKFFYQSILRKKD